MVGLQSHAQSRQIPTIWFTSMLHHPFGTTLLGHPIEPFNGYLGFLQRFLSLAAAYNALLIIDFVAGGLTTSWLSYDITKSFWGSLIAGYIFTFSLFHFFRAQVQLNFLSLEWNPLFFLFWLRLVKKPGFLSAICAAIVLQLVFLTDYYYFLSLSVHSQCGCHPATIY